MCKVSVIMPVYNSKEFLSAAVGGILSQSYRDFELICIEDASTDGSGTILAQYQKRDPRIRLVRHSKNMGAACSRNEGMELARGKYLFFVDADDVFEMDLLKRMVQTAEQEPVDMVYINYDMFEDGDLCDTDIRGNYYHFGRCFSQYNEIRACPKELFRTIPLAPYSRLYSSEFLRRNTLRFQNLKSSNDVYFGIMATLLSQKIAFLEEQVNLVHVRSHGGKYRISNMRNPYDNFRAYICLKQEMERLQLSDGDIGLIQERFLNNTLWELKGYDPKRGKEFYQFINAEGLEKMGLLKEERLVNLDFAYRSIAESFTKKTFESKWFEDVPWFAYHLEKWKTKVTGLFRQMAGQGKECGIWGAGKNGRLLADFCMKHNCRCRGIIDNKKEKWGETLCGYEIFSPEELLEIVDTVIISNQRYFNDIYDQIKTIHKGIEMISLDMYLQYEQDLCSSTILVAD